MRMSGELHRYAHFRGLTRALRLMIKQNNWTF